jgi:hydroxyquinol 1,2-dioxygenase
MLDLDEYSITAEVCRRIAHTPDPRLREIVTALVQHLHDLAREVKLTESEWAAGVDFLVRTGQLCSDTRQEFVLLSDTLGLSQLVVAQSHSRMAGATEQTILGPFHVEGVPKAAGLRSDIAKGAPGEPLYVSVRILSAGAPVAGAVVDVWHADAEGHYDLQEVVWTADKSRMRAVFESDADGRLGFWSILPKGYPIPTDGTVGEMMRATGQSPMRPAHVHFKVKKEGFNTLVTHVFAGGDPYLDADAVFGVRSSCIGNFESQPAGVAPDGTLINSNFFTLDFCFVLEPALAD